jgi:hypothetical protein
MTAYLLGGLAHIRYFDVLVPVLVIEAPEKARFKRKKRRSNTKVARALTSEVTKKMLLCGFSSCPS